MPILGAVLGGLGLANATGLNPIANYNADRDFSKSVDAQRALTEQSYQLSQKNWEKQFVPSFLFSSRMDNQRPSVL